LPFCKQNVLFFVLFDIRIFSVYIEDVPIINVWVHALNSSLDKSPEFKLYKRISLNSGL